MSSNSVLFNSSTLMKDTYVKAPLILELTNRFQGHVISPFLSLVIDWVIDYEQRSEQMHKHHQHHRRGETELMEVAGPHPADKQDPTSTHCPHMGTTRRKSSRPMCTQHQAEERGGQDLEWSRLVCLGSKWSLEICWHQCRSEED